MNDSLKSTRLATCCMAGTTSSLKQSLASGHFDMMWASRDEAWPLDVMGD